MALHTITLPATPSGTGYVHVTSGVQDGAAQNPPAGPVGGTPALTLGVSNVAGSSANFVRDDDTILAFDATAPVTQAFGDSAAAGSAGVAARRDHKHGMPASPTISDATISITDIVTNNASTTAHGF